MENIKISKKSISEYIGYLLEEEKSKATIDKYKRDILAFYLFLPKDKILTKQRALEYKAHILQRYKATSANSMIVSLNRFFAFVGAGDIKIKMLRIQKSNFIESKKEMTKAEYKRLVKAAKDRGNERLCLLLQAICSTGIRVSEYRYITVEALKEGRACVENKGKIRYILFPVALKKMLKEYCRKAGIKSGPVFVTKNGKPLDRSNIWKSMKELCEAAGVEKHKVFPHNLRHLFALTFYRLQKDIVQLADILGHSSVDTTRIYTKSSLRDCQKALGKLGLVGLVC